MHSSNSVKALQCKILCGEPVDWSGNTNKVWMNDFLVSSEYHGIQSLLYHQLKSAASWETCPTIIKNALFQAARQQTILEMMREPALIKLIDALAENHIFPIIMKGSALSYTHYPSSNLRPRCDTDLFIQKSDFGKLTNILQTLGYTAYPVRGELTSYQALFSDDITRHETELSERVANSRFLVIGGAGSIGQAVTREIFKRHPQVLHVVDISENNMVELVRDIRSTLGYIEGDFRTFAIDCGSHEFQALLRWSGDYDYVLNLSALKHVRSEKDPFTLMRMIEVNILNTISTIEHAQAGNARKYFCVSTDKATNPVNMMGASKRIMEMFLMQASLELPISTARFANVAFSDGSLLHGFNQRFAKRQPISAPNDVRRYFITPQESGELCLMSCLLGENRDIFFPKLSEQLDLVTFSDIAVQYLADLGFEAYECETEDEARDRALELMTRKQWPCYFFASDTTGEKDFEEFYTDTEALDMERFESIGVIQNEAVYDTALLDTFIKTVMALKEGGVWNRQNLVDLFHAMLPDFGHKETGKYLDDKM